MLILRSAGDQIVSVPAPASSCSTLHHLTLMLTWSIRSHRTRTFHRSAIASLGNTFLFLVASPSPTGRIRNACRLQVLGRVRDVRESRLQHDAARRVRLLLQAHQQGSLRWQGRCEESAIGNSRFAIDRRCGIAIALRLRLLGVRI